MICPLWSVREECHRDACAFISPRIRELGMLVSAVKRVLMIVSLLKFAIELSLGGMYRFVMFSGLFFSDGI